MNKIKLDIGQLRKRCLQSIDELMTEGDIYENELGEKFSFIDNGGDVLAIFHSDVSPAIASQQDWFHVQREGSRRRHWNTVNSPALDDRLGAYIILDVLPKLGVKCDVLITEDEEIGRSTASMFDTEKKYNWMFQFDRRGTDVVMYDYETDELSDAISMMGGVVGIGSFSDICYLEHLGISGLNFGTGYHKEHTLRCHADLRDTTIMIELFMDFYNTYSEVRFEYVPRVYAKYTSYTDASFPQASYNAPGWASSFYDDEYYDNIPEDGKFDDDMCDFCATQRATRFYHREDSNLCSECAKFCIPEYYDRDSYVSLHDDAKDVLYQKYGFNKFGGLK